MELRNRFLFGNKHDKPTSLMNTLVNEHDDIKFVICIKNPKAWIVSVSKWLNAKLTDSFVKLWMNKYIDKYNAWFDFYSKNNKEGFIFVWESVLNNNSLKNEITNMKDKLYLDKIKNYKMYIKKIVRSNQKLSSDSFNRNYYINKNYIYELSDELITYIDSEVNKRILNAIESISPKLFEMYYC